MTEETQEVMTNIQYEEIKRKIRQVLIRSIILMVVFFGLAVLYFLFVLNVKSSMNKTSEWGIRLIMFPFMILIIAGAAQLKAFLNCIIYLRRLGSHSLEKR